MLEAREGDVRRKFVNWLSTESTAPGYATMMIEMIEWKEIEKARSFPSG